jgi:hypothetical protein
VIDCFASRPHYWHHVEPIWRLLAARGAAGTAYTHRTIGHRRGPETATRPVMVASWQDAHYMSRSPVVYVEHGAGQQYQEAAPGWAGGPGLEHVRLFVCPSVAVADAWRAAYPAAAVEVAGCPVLDAYHQGRERGGRRGTRPAVAVTFHWDCGLVPETRTAWPHYDPALPALRDWCAASGVDLVGHAHPRIWRRLERRWRQLGVDAEPGWANVLGRVDVLVADNSSVMFEHASLDRPVVVLNAPWYRRDVEHGGRFWRWADVGEQVDGPGQLVDAVCRAVTDPAAGAGVRARVTADVYAHRDGRAAERAADAIVRELLP